MPHVHVEHNTTYRYAAPVQLTEHRLMLRPHDSHDLRVLDATLWITPPGARTRWAHDVFGNSVCILDWENAETEELRIVSALDLKHYPTATDLPIEPAAETYPFRYAGDEYPDLSRLMERHYADPDRQVEKWARSFLRPGGTARTRDLLIAMTQAIKSDFTYEGREAKGTHPPLKTLAERKGACRDFAVLMMEAARSLGLSHWQAMRQVVLPQAFRRMLPPLGNNAIALLKDSSLISAIGLAELAYAARTVASTYSRYWEPYLTISLLYWILTLALAWGVRGLEGRYGRGDTR